MFSWKNKTRAEKSRRTVWKSCRDLSHETDSGPKTKSDFGCHLATGHWILTRTTPTTTTARQQLSHLARPLDHSAQGPNILCGESLTSMTSWTPWAHRTTWPCVMLPAMSTGTPDHRIVQRRLRSLAHIQNHCSKPFQRTDTTHAGWSQQCGFHFACAHTVPACLHAQQKSKRIDIQSCGKVLRGSALPKPMIFRSVCMHACTANTNKDAELSSWHLSGPSYSAPFRCHPRGISWLIIHLKTRSHDDTWLTRTSKTYSHTTPSQCLH